MVDAVQVAPGAAAAASLPNAIAIASGKGGVGKTWLSATLCHVLARAGSKALLFDGDLGLANVDIQLGLAPRRDLAGVVAGRCRLSDAVIAYGEGEFLELLAQENQFPATVLEGPVLWLIGSGKTLDEFRQAQPRKSRARKAAQR